MWVLGRIKLHIGDDLLEPLDPRGAPPRGMAVLKSWDYVLDLGCAYALETDLVLF